MELIPERDDTRLRRSADAMQDPLVPLHESVSGSWLEASLDAISKEPTFRTLARAFADAGRRIGRSAADSNGGTDSAVDAARLRLIEAAAALVGKERYFETIDRLFKSGSSGERISVLRLLPRLPEPEQLIPIGVEACRSHVQPVFEAIACENPYPAEHFAELNFNQMVLKAVFTGIPLARIRGLHSRHGKELERMARAYASERRAAGRSVPEDLVLLTREGDGQ